MQHVKDSGTFSCNKSLRTSTSLSSLFPVSNTTSLFSIQFSACFNHQDLVTIMTWGFQWWESSRTTSLGVQTSKVLAKTFQCSVRVFHVCTTGLTSPTRVQSSLQDNRTSITKILYLHVCFEHVQNGRHGSQFSKTIQSVHQILPRLKRFLSRL